MTKLIALVIAALVVGSSLAEAACPLGTKYQCRPTFSGKMQCGCF